MNSTVFRHALRLSRKTVIIALVGFAAFLYLGLLGSSLVLQDFAAMADAGGFLENPPKAVQALSGGSLDFFSPFGWLASSIMHPISLTLQTMAALTIAVSIPTEVERGTLDLVLSRPLSRASYLLSKVAAGISAIALVELAGLAVVLLARLTLIDLAQVSVAAVLRMFAGSFCLFLAFAMVAFLIASRSSLRGRALGLAVGVVVGSFFLNFLGLLFEDAGFIRYLSPFHYFSPAGQLSGDAPAYDLAVLFGIAVAAGLAALRFFSTRDLTR